MSLLSDIAELGGLLARLVGIKRGPKVERIPEPRKWAHYVPPANTVESFVAGAGRCYYCHVQEGSREWSRPCPRRWPVELA